MKTIILAKRSVRGRATRKTLGLRRWPGRVQMPYLYRVFSTGTPLILICAALMALGPDMRLWQILLTAALWLVVGLLGILSNAFVCGAIPQSANRYGTRVTRPMAGPTALSAWPKLAAAPRPRMECLA